MKWLKDHIQRWPEPPLRVLDVGAGNGHIRREVASMLTSQGEKGPQDKVAWRCIDVGGTVKVAGGTVGFGSTLGFGAAADVEHFDGQSLPATNQSVDLVLFNWVLHHAGDRFQPAPWVPTCDPWPRPRLSCSCHAGLQPPAEGRTFRIPLFAGRSACSRRRSEFSVVSTAAS